MGPLIIHGKRVTEHSPRSGRPECGLWGVTRANCRFWKGKLLDWTEWMDIHPLAHAGRFEGIPTRRADAWHWYRSQDGSRPIWLMAPEHHPPDKYQEALDRFHEIPGARRFPIREIQAAFPIAAFRKGVRVEEPNRFFVEQTGMMIAFALMRGAGPIYLNGVGVSTSLEFQIAHRSILYWIAFARGRGVDVFIEGPSNYHTPSDIYAYEAFNYEACEAAAERSRELTQQQDFASQHEVNRRERARGRPIRHKVVLPGDIW
jgi:hypothetical protein